MTQHDDLIAELAAQVADLRAEVSALQQRLATAPTAPANAIEHSTVADAAPRGTSRRSLLRGAAAATAAAAVATVAVGGVQQAHAAPEATGGAFTLGQANDANATTTLQPTSGSTPSSMLTVTTSVRFGTAFTANTAMGTGFSATDTGGGTGLYGNSAGGTGVFGITSTGYGVYGVSNSSPAVFGSSSSAQGILGQSQSGYGVAGASVSGDDLAATGTGLMFQKLSRNPGPPTSGTYMAGQSLRDALGDLWLCISGDGTTLGQWARVALVAPGVYAGGAVTYLGKPIRLLDTRPGQPAANQPGAPYTTSSTHNIAIAGVNYAGVQVPTSCVGAVVNLTVLNASSGNYVALVPGGAGFSGTSNLDVAPGQIVSNSANVGLSGGVLDIIMGNGGSADVILDLFAVIS